MKATTFGWKRKAGGKVASSVSAAFEDNAADENCDPPDGVDWLSGYKRRRNLLLEDCAQKSLRLRQEGTMLAELERYWEALKKFDEALQLTPGDIAIHEMRAQVLMLLREDFAAVQEAEQVVKLGPCWWVAHQTLGRARLQLGEIHMALRSFCCAVHLNPADEELRKDDLLYTLHLLRQKQVAEQNAKEASVCFDEDGHIIEIKDSSVTPELICCRETR